MPDARPPRGPVTDPNLRHPVADRPDPRAADLKPFKPYVYRGQGHDIFEEEQCPESTPPSGAGAGHASGPPRLSLAREGAGPTPPAPTATDAQPAAMSLTATTTELLFSEIPASCACTWSWGPPAFRWERIGAKESCPWHRLADSAAALAKDGRWNL